MDPLQLAVIFSAFGKTAFDFWMEEHGKRKVLWFWENCFRLIRSIGFSFGIYSIYWWFFGAFFVEFNAGSFSDLLQILKTTCFCYIESIVPDFESFSIKLTNKPLNTSKLNFSCSSSNAKESHPVHKSRRKTSKDTLKPEIRHSSAHFPPSKKIRL